MSISSIVIIVLMVIIIIALGILFSTRKRLKEMEGFQSIKEPGKDDDDGVIGSFGE
jgi:hypothetical protein